MEFQTLIKDVPWSFPETSRPSQEDNQDPQGVSHRLRAHFVFVNACALKRANGATLGRVAGKQRSLSVSRRDGSRGSIDNKGRLYLITELVPSWLFFRCVSHEPELPCVSAKHHGNNLRKSFHLRVSNPFS